MKEHIRTYTRKPQECRYIEGVLGLCRLCLGAADEAVSIFTEDPSDMCSSVALRIMMCVGFEVERHEHLPNIVCLSCYKELERYYTFRKKCEASYQKLKSHMLAVRNRQGTAEVATESEVTVKQVDDVDEDENVDVTELVLIDGGENILDYDKVLEEPELVDSDKQNVSPVKIEDSEIQKSNPPTMDSEELSSLITSVLLKLGVVSEQGGCYSLAGDTSKVQLETGDGCVIRMELCEEDEQSAGSPWPEPVARAEGAAASANEPKGNRSTSKSPLRCGVCGRAQASRSALRRHARTHSGERPYACPACALRFAQKEVMQRHMLVHADKRPHQCQHCPKSFTQRGALELHARAHVAPHERPMALHQCPHCPKLFLYSSGLSRHILSHEGRVYSCGACSRVFNDKSSVLRHIRRTNHGPAPANTTTTNAQPQVNTKQVVEPNETAVSTDQEAIVEDIKSKES